MPDSRSLSVDELLGHGRWLRRLAERLVGGSGADDLVQEAWITALLHRPQIAGPWLRRVLHNLSVSDTRARTRRRAREVEHARPEALPSACDLAARAETTRLLVEAVLRLKPVQRDVILLRYFDDLPPERIARHLGLCSATVRSHLARGLACLRRDLDAAAGGRRASWTRALVLFSTKSATTSASPLLTGILMTTTQKLAALLVLLLVGTGTLWWRNGADGPKSPLISKGLETTGSETAVHASPPASDDRDARRDEQEDRRVVTETVSADSTRIRVVHAETGKVLPKATVLHVASGFDWAQLDPAAKEEYSLATERFLRKFGEAKQSDDDGVVEIPGHAAHAAIVGRTGELYGIHVDRGAENLWTLALSPHSELVVEVVDASGRSLAGRRVMQEDTLSLSSPLRMARPLGTTDENGRVAHLFQVPSEGARSQTSCVYVSLPGVKVGSLAWDPRDPPRSPLRIVLPTVGTVTVLILDPSGSRLDPEFLADPNVELAVVAGTSATAPRGAELFSARHFAPIEADGYARFRDVPVGGTLSISAPSLLGSSLRFTGPREDELDVFVQHRMHEDHPLLVGRLVDEASRPLPNARFSIQCRSGAGHLLMVGGKTDDLGRFAAYLPENVMGERPDITFGMDWDGTEPTRAARVSTRGPLLGSVPVGDVVMPPAKE